MWEDTLLTPKSRLIHHSNSLGDITLKSILTLLMIVGAPICVAQCYVSSLDPGGPGAPAPSALMESPDRPWDAVFLREGHSIEKWLKLENVLLQWVNAPILESTLTQGILLGWPTLQDTLNLDGPTGGASGFMMAMLHEYVHHFQFTALKRDRNTDPRSIELEADLLTSYYSGVRSRRQFEDNLPLTKVEKQLDKWLGISIAYYLGLDCPKWEDPKTHGTREQRQGIIRTGFAAGREGRFGKVDATSFLLGGSGEEWLQAEVSATLK